MRDLPAIAALYEEVDEYLESLRPDEERVDEARRETIDRKQRINQIASRRR